MFYDANQIVARELNINEQAVTNFQNDVYTLNLRENMMNFLLNKKIY